MGATSLCSQFKCAPARDTRSSKFLCCCCNSVANTAAAFTRHRPSKNSRRWQSTRGDLGFDVRHVRGFSPAVALATAAQLGCFLTISSAPTRKTLRKQFSHYLDGHGVLKYQRADASSLSATRTDRNSAVALVPEPKPDLTHHPSIANVHQCLDQFRYQSPSHCEYKVYGGSAATRHVGSNR